MLPSKSRQGSDNEDGHANEPTPSSSAIENLQPSNNSGGRLQNWRATKTTITERLSFLFNNEILSDVHFIVGNDANQQVIPAHKFVLSAGSAVFDAMFNGVLATEADEIELPDVEPAAFLHLLQFLYSDEVKIRPESVMTTLYTAKKYAVAALEEHCVEILKVNSCTDADLNAVVESFGKTSIAESANQRVGARSRRAREQVASSDESAARVRAVALPEHKRLRARRR